MTGTPTSPEHRVSIRQITDLLAWARRLAEQPFDADPPERAVFHQAKTDLLARISNDITGPDQTTDQVVKGGGA